MSSAADDAAAFGGNAPPEADAYFQDTIGSYRCGICETEFTVDGVLFTSRDLADGVDCPICGHSGELKFTPVAGDEEVEQ